MIPIHSINSRNYKSDAILTVFNKKNKFSFYDHNRMVISVGVRKIIIPFKQITFIKSDGNYCEIHMVDKRRFLVSKTLKDTGRRLNELFYRSHQSYIVNLLHVTQYNTKSSKLTMINDECVPVARSRKSSMSKLISL